MNVQFFIFVSLVTTLGDDNRRPEAAVVLQSLSLPREGRSANDESASETGNTSATLNISDQKVQVKRLGHPFPNTILVDLNDSTLAMDVTAEAPPGRPTLPAHRHRQWSITYDCT